MAHVSLLDTVTSDGLLLTGLLQVPHQLSQPPGIDAVLMIHGNGANFHSSYQQDFAKHFISAGIPVLNANTRGHGMLNMAVRLSSGPPSYVGTSVERLEECVQDFDAWTAKLRTLGYERLLLWGHSRGAVKVAYYLAQGARSPITNAVLSSPPLLSFKQWMQSDRANEFQVILDRCKAQIASGDPEGLIAVTLPLPYMSGASQYLDSYGPQEKYNVLDLIRRIEIPLLAITGTLETRMFPFMWLPELFEKYAARVPSFRYLSVPEGDHVYTGQRAWVLSRVLEWLGCEHR